MSTDFHGLFLQFQHFNDITSLYTLKPPFESTSMNDVVPLQENISSATNSGSQVPFPEAFLPSFQPSSPFTEYSGSFHEQQNSKSCSPRYGQRVSCTLSHNVMAPSVVYEGDISSFQGHNKVDRQHRLFPKTRETGRRVDSPLTQNSIDRFAGISREATTPQLWCDQTGNSTYFGKCGQNRRHLSKAARGQNVEMPVFLKNTISQAAQDVHGLEKQCNSALDSKQPWFFLSNKDAPFQQCSSSFLGDFGRRGPGSPESQFEENFSHLLTQEMDLSSRDPSFCEVASSPDIFFNVDFQTTREYAGKKGPHLLSSKQREQEASAGMAKCCVCFFKNSQVVTITCQDFFKCVLCFHQSFSDYLVQRRLCWKIFHMF